VSAELQLCRPDDLHLHLRDGAALATVLPFSVARFARAMIMPNLVPPLTTTAQVQAYRARILAALPPGASFEPLMTLYLTDHTSAAEIERAHASGTIHGAKL
jgi:dihydroorotase